MILIQPFEISSRLLPSVKIADMTISLKREKLRNDRFQGEQVWRYYLDLDNGKRYTRADMGSGLGDNSTQSAMGSLLAFLGACGESVAYADRTGRSGENADLFPKWVGEWCVANSDEMGMMQCDIEDRKDLITE